MGYPKKFFYFFISAIQPLPTAEVSARSKWSHAVNHLTECPLLDQAAWYHVQFCNGLLCDQSSELNVSWLILMRTKRATFFSITLVRITLFLLN